MASKVALLALMEMMKDDELETAAVNHIRTSVRVLDYICNSKDFADFELEDRDPTAHVENYYEETVPKYTNLQFREHFRMDRDTFEELCQWLAPYLPKERSVPTDKKLLATLWLVGNKESFRAVADRFGMNKGRLHHVVMMVCQALTDRRADVIQWPDHHQLKCNTHQFGELHGMPGVVGAIDGTHIPIPGPSDHRDSYINRNGDPSIQLQVACDANLFFLDAYTGWPGSVHDARVFRNSPLKDHLEGAGALPPDCHLLGDSAYGLTNYMLVPFRDNGHLSVVEKRFNAAHSSTRVEVERAIGLLKGKFRRLKYLEMTKVESMPVVIFAACALHNFVIYHSGIHEDDIDLSDSDSDTENDGDGVAETATEKKACNRSHALLIVLLEVGWSCCCGLLYSTVTMTVICVIFIKSNIVAVTCNCISACILHL